MSDARLRKDERLKSSKQLGALFADGQSVRVFPIRLVWMMVAHDGIYPARVAFSASKRYWKRAVDRNLLKRRMREAYRLQKHILYASAPASGQQILIACIYTSDTILPFEQIKHAMGKGLERLTAQLTR